MAKREDTFDNPIPYDQHPLHHEAMQQIAEGNEDAAVSTLQRLAEIYPKEQALQDRIVRLQLRTTFGSTDYIPLDRTPPAPVLRTAVLMLLAVTACMVVVAALAAAYNRLWVPQERAREQEQYIESLWQDVSLRIDAGDLSGAREILDTLATQAPGDPRLQDKLQVVTEQQAWANLYADAVAYKERSEWQTAVDLANQIPAASPDYDRAQQLIQSVQELSALETAWQGAQTLLQAEDWQGALSDLTWIRAQNPEFRRAEVEDQLYQVHSRMAQQLLSQANGNVDLVRQAISHLNEALALRPTDQSLIEAQRLAAGFVAGSEAHDRGDWVGVVTRWEPVYRAQPDYQGGSLKQALDEAYPLAAMQLISQSNGSERLLRQAVGYLDQALLTQPDNQQLREERQLAADYLSGLEAAAKTDWDLAVSYWGPIHQLRPDYLNGKVADNLRLACANSSAPSATFCTP